MFQTARYRLIIGALTASFMWLGAQAASAAELIMFETAGCPWCALWNREVGIAYPKTAEGRRAPLRHADLSEAKTIGVTFAAPVNASPTFVLVDGGREVGRITGYPGADFFWGLLGGMLLKLGPESAPESH